MRKLSLKRAAEIREYSNIRKGYLTQHPYCDAQVQCCGVMATEIHHKKGRTGTLLTDTRYFLATCRLCHIWIEEHPKEAKEKGFSLSRLHD